MFVSLNNCLVCGSNQLIEEYNLGLQPLVNNLKDTPKQDEISLPIIVNSCQFCTHKQLSIAVDPKLLFSNYLYQTGISKSHMDFFKDFVLSLGTDRKVLDIGCNDGVLLSYFQDNDWSCTGIDPAENLVGKAYALLGKNAHIINDFFPTEELEGYGFDVITAFNVFAHNDDPRKFLEEMGKLLNKDGRIYILTTPARLDNLYHEHISYFTPQSMIVLAQMCNLTVRSFKEVPMHGKSYLFELSHSEEESSLVEIPEQNKPVVAYGASATGIVLMNYLDLYPDYVIDDNELKQGKFIPGLNVPIYNSTFLETDPRALFIIVLAYHLFDEIVNKIKLMRPLAKDTFFHPYKGVV